MQEVFLPGAVHSLAGIGSCEAHAVFWIPSQVALCKLVHYQLSPQHGALSAPSKPATCGLTQAVGFMPRAVVGMHDMGKVIFPLTLLFPLPGYASSEGVCGSVSPLNYPAGGTVWFENDRHQPAAETN